MHEWNKLQIEHDGILYRKTNEREQLVLPQKYHRLALKHLHEEMGHVGANRVIELARERFYWPHMAWDIQHYVTKVGERLKRKKPVVKGSVSSSIPCTCRPLANLCLSPFSWAMKMATTKANQETTRARHAG